MVRLIHYTDAKIGPLEVRPQGDDQFKPHGLWVSDQDCEDNWPAWCLSEDFGLERLTLAYEVTLIPDANVRYISSTDEIDAFTQRWAVHPLPDIKSNMWIDWTGVRAECDGLIITPYIYERRLSYGGNDAMWYYSWDCASGCIWDPRAIATITPVSSQR